MVLWNNIVEPTFRLVGMVWSDIRWIYSNGLNIHIVKLEKTNYNKWPPSSFRLDLLISNPEYVFQWYNYLWFSNNPYREEGKRFPFKSTQNPCRLNIFEGVHFQRILTYPQPSTLLKTNLLIGIGQVFT